LAKMGGAGGQAAGLGGPVQPNGLPGPGGGSLPGLGGDKK